MFKYYTVWTSKIQYSLLSLSIGRFSYPFCILLLKGTKMTNVRDPPHLLQQFLPFLGQSLIMMQAVKYGQEAGEKEKLVRKVISATTW